MRKWPKVWVRISRDDWWKATVISLYGAYNPTSVLVRVDFDPEGYRRKGEYAWVDLYQCYAKKFSETFDIPEPPVV